MNVGDPGPGGAGTATADHERTAFDSHEDRPVHASPFTQSLDRALWIVVPLGCAIWVASISTRYYPVYDEWVMIDRATSMGFWRGLFIGFNGHMWSLAAAAYNAQVHLLDLQSNWFVPALLVVSLVALQVSVAAVLFRLGLPALVALLTATVVTYFGRGSETMVYQHLFPYNFALAFSCAAGYVALGRRRDRRTAVVVALLLLAALPCDSALAVTGLLFVAVLVLVLWPFRLALLALVPPAVGHLAWLVLDRSEALFEGACQNCGSVTFSAPLGDSARFAWGIFVRSAGGLAAGGATAGVLLLVAAGGCTVFGLATRRLSRPVVASLVAGLVAALSTVALLAQSRAGFWATIDEAIARLGGVSNRYVQPAAIFLMIALAPAVAATIRPARRVPSALVVGAATVALVAVFVANLGNVWATRDFYRGWSASVKAQVQEAVDVVSSGCEPGERLDTNGQPVDVSFQISVALLGELLDRGALRPSFGRPASPEVRARICVSK